MKIRLGVSIQVFVILFSILGCVFVEFNNRKKMSNVTYRRALGDLIPFQASVLGPSREKPNRIPALVLRTT